jgi:hypothetical protein
MLAFASRASMYANVALGVVEAPVIRGSEASSQAREGHEIESSGLVSTTEEGGLRKEVGVSQGVVVGHDVGAIMGDTNGEVPPFWSSASFASATFNYLESVTIWPSNSLVLIVNSSVARAFSLRKASSRLYFKDIYRGLLHDVLVFLPLQGDILH